MPFNEIFGGNTIYPANPTYLALALTEDIELEWPIEQAISGLVLAAILDVTPSGAGLSITLPDARLGSTGYVTTFYNAGADDYTVLDAAGGTVLTVGSGEAWNIYLRANATLAGLWRIFEMGAGTSTANAATLAGAGLVAISTTLNEEMEVVTQPANYVIVNADRATVQTWTGGSGNFTLPDPGVVGANWFVSIKNNGSGSLTLLPTSGTIDGSSSLILATLDSAFLVSDGVNFFTMGLGQEINSVFDFISIDVSGTGDFTLTGAQLNRVSYRFTGVLTGNRNIIVPASVQQYWIDNSTTGAFTLTVKTLAGTGILVAQGSRTILYCDGTDVINAETIIVNIPAVVQGDLLYGVSAGVLGALAKSATATRYLSNTGATNNPAWAQVDLTNGVTGTLPATNGGTGLATYTQGDILYSSAANTLAKLAKDTNATRYLTNTGSSNNPAWGQVNLANGVTGTLALGNGGTGQTSANAALNALLPSQGGHSGEVLTTNGTNTSWSSSSAPTTGSGNITLTGLTSGAVTASVSWTMIGSLVMFNVAAATGTSNTTALGATGWPAAITPAAIAPVMAMHSLTDNSVILNQGVASINTSGDLTLSIGDPASSTGFTNSGTKGWTQWSGSYYKQ